MNKKLKQELEKQVKNLTPLITEYCRPESVAAQPYTGMKPETVQRRNFSITRGVE